MSINDVIEHVIDRSLRCITFSVVTPFTGCVMRCIRTAMRQATAQWLVAVSIRPLGVVRIVVRIGQMEHFERWHLFLGQWNFAWIRFWHRWKCYFPLMIRIIHVAASIANNKTANLVWSNRDTFQHVNHFDAEQMTDSFAHSRTLNFQIYTKLIDGLDDLLFALASLDVMLQ